MGAVDPATVVRFLRAVFKGRRGEGAFLLRIGDRVLGQPCRSPLPFHLISRAAEAGQTVAFSPALRAGPEHGEVVEIPAVCILLRGEGDPAGLLQGLGSLHPVAAVAVEGGIDVYLTPSSTDPRQALTEARRFAEACGGKAASPDAFLPLPLTPEALLLPASEPLSRQPPGPARGTDTEDRQNSADAFRAVLSAACDGQIDRVIVVRGRPVEIVPTVGGVISVEIPTSEQALVSLRSRVPPGASVTWLHEDAAVVTFQGPSGEAEHLRDLLGSGASVLVTGPATGRKTCFARDAARILSSGPGRLVLLLEVEGLPEDPSPSRALRLVLGRRDDPVMVAEHIARAMYPDAVVMSRVEDAAHARALLRLLAEGIRVVASLPCRDIEACLYRPEFLPLLGLWMDPSTGRVLRRYPPPFDAVVELPRSGPPAIYTGPDQILNRISVFHHPAGRTGPGG